MCHESVIAWAGSVLTPTITTGRTVVEVGSYDVNGTVRPVIEPHAKSYLGVDIMDGPGVDVVCDVVDLPGRYPSGFDLVVSTEMLEHVVDWRAAIHALTCLVTVGGMLAVTTRSPGFPYHPYPIDTWRWPVDQMRTILTALGLDVDSCVDDPQQAGVFAVATKPESWENHPVTVLDALTIPEADRNIR